MEENLFFCVSLSLSLSILKPEGDSESTQSGVWVIFQQRVTPEKHTDGLSPTSSEISVCFSLFFCLFFPSFFILSEL